MNSSAVRVSTLIAICHDEKFPFQNKCENQTGQIKMCPRSLQGSSLLGEDFELVASALLKRKLKILDSLKSYRLHLLFQAVFLKT